MEPNLQQMSDYDRALTPKKKRAILTAFAVATALALSYTEVMRALS